MALFGSMAPCPYCYIPINPDRVAIRCSGQSAAGKMPCARKPDEVRRRHFSDGTPVLPVITKPDGGPVLAKSRATCGQCGADSGIRVCPECHTLLPWNLNSDSPLFGLVGVRNSGKTVLLSVLHKELLTTVARRFDASISTPGGSSGLARDLERWADSMTQNGGMLPRQTDATGGEKKQPAVYEWRYTRKGVAGLSRAASSIFSFYDNAGEDVSTPNQALSQVYLGAASGIILMLDPFAFPANRTRAKERGVKLAESGTPEGVLDAITLVLQTANRIKRNKKIKQPIAVLISKIDAFFDEIPDGHPLRRPSSTSRTFDEEEAQSVHDHIATMIADWGGDGLIRSLEQNYTTFRLFGASALGAEPDYASGHVNSRGVLPHRVAEPLLWLMADRGFIPKAA